MIIIVSLIIMIIIIILTIMITSIFIIFIIIIIIIMISTIVKGKCGVAPRGGRQGEGRALSHQAPRADGATALGHY